MDDDRNYEDSDYYNNLMDGGVSEKYFSKWTEIVRALRSITTIYWKISLWTEEGVSWDGWDI